MSSFAISHFSWQIPKIFQEPSEKAHKIWRTFQSILGSPVKDVMLPRTRNLSKKQIEMLQKEKDFFKNFWDPSLPLNPQLPYQEAIRKHFVWKKEALSIEVQATPLLVECSIIEPAHQTNAQNFVLLLGNLSLHDDNITGVYPFLVSYLKEREKNPNMPGIRFILISQYDTKMPDNSPFIAHNLDEIGQVLAKALSALQKAKGEIIQLMGYSLGTIALSAALPYIPSEDLPKNIYWDGGPSSLELISQSHGLKGWFLWNCAKVAGWDFDLGLNIRKYLGDRKDQKIYIAEVENDSFFAKESSLARSPHLQDLKEEQGFHAFSFDFVQQLHDERTHHSIHNGYLDHFHLKNPKTTELKTKESMADLLIRSFPKKPTSQSFLSRWIFSSGYDKKNN
jgi:hypothetical protein